jgi:LPXTG-motif cell wall-anchored protein
MPRSLAIAAAALTAALVATSAPAAAEPGEEPYSIGATTEVTVDAPDSVAPGEPVVATVDVAADVDAGLLRGRLDITVVESDAEGEGEAKHTGTVPFDGDPVTLDLPGLEEGSYEVSAQFRPAFPLLHSPSEGRDGYVVGAAPAVPDAEAPGQPGPPDQPGAPDGGAPDGGVPDGAPDGGTPDGAPGAPGGLGALPDTGGPASTWLLLGLALLGAGAAAVAYARRHGRAA